MSVLKPLNGADAGLYDNLKSFFEQDHAGARAGLRRNERRRPGPRDRSRACAREFPNVRCQVVVHAGGSALNPKVSNLLGMLPRRPVTISILISDSNVRAPRHYVSELARVHGATGAGIVTNLFAGSAENTLGGALENVQLNGFCAAGCALPTLVGDAAVIGKIDAIFALLVGSAGRAVALVLRARRGLHLGQDVPERGSARDHRADGARKPERRSVGCARRSLATCAGRCCAGGCARLPRCSSP